MKIIIICLSFLGFFTTNKTTISNDGVESVVIQCGTDPDGNWDCVRMEFDDGSDCIVIDNEGAPSGILFINC